jgi:hypothetical protein
MIDHIKSLLENTQALDRMKQCLECKDFNKTTTVCRQCGCLMCMKVLIPNASCPLKKW